MKNVLLPGDYYLEKKYIDLYAKHKSRQWKCKIMLIDYELKEMGFTYGYECKFYDTRKGVINVNLPEGLIRHVRKMNMVGGLV